MSVKIERKYLAHFIDTNPLGTSPSTTDTNYVRIGKDLEDYTENLNADVSTEKNILGESTVVHNGYSVNSNIDNLFVRMDGSTPEPLANAIMEIANERLTGVGTTTTKVDVLMDQTGKVIWAYRENVVVAPDSIGGDTSGVKVPFTINNDGGRVKGTFDMATKKFTPEVEETA